ncbi:MAG: hypothetical protein Crog4KO_26540 [Crocinitomicaceae bacterium]
MKGKQEKALFEIKEDLKYLTRLSSIQNWMHQKEVSEKDLLELMKIRQSYDQIRILDTLGREVIRINNDSQPKKVDSTSLQDKSKRDYFQFAKKLKPNQCYASPISLNIENDKVELPKKPVFRIIAPILNGKTRIGYICINYKAKRLLRKIELGELSKGNFDLADGDNTLVSDLLGIDSVKRGNSAAADVLQMKAKDKNQLSIFEDSKNKYFSTKLQWDEPDEQQLPGMFEFMPESNQQFTLVYYVPKSAFTIHGDFIFKLFIIAFIIFSAFYLMTLRYMNIQRKERLQSDSQLQSIFSNTLTIMGLSDIDGVLLEANDALIHLVNGSKNEIIDRKIDNLPLWSSAVDKKQLQQAIFSAKNGNKARLEVGLVDGNGQTKIFDFTINPAFNDHGEVIHLVTEGADITERNRLQTELQEKNRQYASIQKISKTGTWTVDVMSNEVTWDEMVCAIHEEPSRQPFSVVKAIHYYREDYRPIIEEAVEKAIEENQPWDLEAVIITKSGKEKWVHAIGYPVFKDGKLIELRGTFSDIDERKQLELKIKESNELVKLALKSGGLGTWDWDIINNKLKWDDTMYTLYDVDKKTFSSDYDAWKTTLHKDDLEESNKKVQHSVDTGEDLDIVFRILTRQNKVRHIKANAKVIANDEGLPIRMIGVNLDITHLTEANQKIYELNQSLEEKVKIRTDELLKAKNELEQQLELIGKAAMVSETDLKGEIIHANQTFCEMSGYTLDELKQHSHSILNSGIQKDQLYQDLWDTITNGKTWQSELCNKKKTGELYWVNATIQPFYDNNGKICRYTGVFFDITRQKESTRKVIEANEKLDSAIKELETFSYSVSHDLKAPLRALQGFSKNLVEHYTDSLDDKGVRWLNFIRDNAARMDVLIADILSFSRINKTTIQKSEFSMRNLIEIKIDTIGKAYDTPNKVTISSELPNVACDQNMIEMVWQNLIDNAFKYSQKEECIEISIWAESDKRGATYFIKDNGVGFDMKYYDKIFGVFQRLHSNEEFEGTGVGLAHVFRIINKHDGTISARSVLNEGTTFQFFLPKN